MDEVLVKMKDSRRVTEDGVNVNQKAGRHVTEEDLKANIVKESFYSFDQLTICVLTLKNGFTVVGESACADPAMYDVAIGRRIARENAERKIWPLMGYALREDIMREAEPTDYRDRVRKEANELGKKIAKLENPINDHWHTMTSEQQTMLQDQYYYMKKYYQVLMERINLFNI